MWAAPYQTIFSCSIRMNILAQQCHWSIVWFGWNMKVRIVLYNVNRNSGENDTQKYYPAHKTYKPALIFAIFATCLQLNPNIGKLTLFDICVNGEKNYSC